MAVSRDQVVTEITAVDKTAAAVASATNSLGKLTKQQQQANIAADRSMRQLRAGWQQAGFQLQDIAVQYQMGTNPFVILSQQGSQLLSIFGAGGALAGALLSIGGIVGMSLAPSIFSAKTAIDKLKESSKELNDIAKSTGVDGIRSLTDSFYELSQMSMAAARIQIGDRIRVVAQDLEASRGMIAKEAGAIAEAFAGLGSLETLTVPNKRKLMALQSAWGLDEQSIASIVNTAEVAFSGAAEDIKGFSELLLGIREQNPGVSESFVQLTSKINDMYVEVLRGEKTLEQAQTDLSNLGDLIANVGAETTKADTTIEDMTRKLQQQIETYGYGSTAIAVYEARLAGANLEEQETIALLAGEIELRQLAIDALDAEKKAIEARDKASEAARGVIKKEALALADPIDQLNQSFVERQDALRAALETEGIIQTEHNQLMIDLEKARIDAIAEYERESYDKQMQLVQARFQAAGKLAGALAGVFEEGTAAQRAALSIQKGLAVGEAIMNMHRAISSANAVPWPQNFAAIAQAASTGISAIAGIRAASFEGGGFTGYGARAGGIDGRGGMPAIVHPNESIIDHTKGGGGTNVNITIMANDTRGFDELLLKRRGVIASLVQSSLNNMGRSI